MKHKNLWQSAVLIGIVASSATSMANVKIYPALLCVEQSDTTPEMVYKQESSGAYAENTAAGGNNWICPVVRDDENGTVEDWDVTVNRNGNTGASWDITLWSANKTGASGWIDTISVPATTGVQNLDGDSVSSFENGGQVFITSAAPADVRLHSYSIDE